jgi:hypothetical protein
VTPDANRALAARILVLTGMLMLVAAALIWTGTLPVAQPLRRYLGIGLGAAGAADLVMAIFFAKGSNGSGRI